MDGGGASVDLCATPFPRLIVQFCASIPAATSDGTRQGLDSMKGGVCATQGMKVVLKVGQSKSLTHTRTLHT